jgi:hypothetical protein
MRGILDALLGISAEVAAEWSLRDFMDSRGDVSLSCRKRIKQPVKLCFSSQLPTQRYQLRHTPCTPCVPSLRRHHQGPDMIFYRSSVGNPRESHLLRELVQLR